MSAWSTSVADAAAKNSHERLCDGRWPFRRLDAVSAKIESARATFAAAVNVWRPIFCGLVLPGGPTFVGSRACVVTATYRTCISERNPALRSGADTRDQPFGGVLTASRELVWRGERFVKLDRVRIRRSMRWAAAIITIAVLFDTAWTRTEAASAKSGGSHIDPALLAQAKAHPSSTCDVIVRAARQKTKLAPRAKANTADKAGKAVKRAGGTPKRSLGIVGGASAKVRGAELIALANDPDVAFIFADTKLVTKFDPQVSAPLVTEPGQLEVNAPAAWSTFGVIGRGIGIAVVDSGIYAHPDLAGRIVAAIDFTSSMPVVSSAALGDAGGHGTHVAGLIAGDGTASGGAYAGVAPGANLVDVRVINADGVSSVSTVLAGLQWVLANRATYNIRVVNLSLGAPEQASYTLSALSAAVEILWFAGISVIVSAGNGGPAAARANNPGGAPLVITLGPGGDAGPRTTNARPSATTASLRT